jgi:protein-arginine kinase activator protein McsA
MKCYLCNGDNFIVRPGEVRNNNKIKVIECKSCGLVTLDNLSHISERHYEEGKMHAYENTIKEWIQETEIEDSRRFNKFKKKIRIRSCNKSRT